MRFAWNVYTQVLLVISFTFFYCEYLIYYLVISQCSWPELKDDQNSSMIKSMFLADTHLLGPFRGHWFDKLRREWQMYRSFQSAVFLYKPEVVFFLGDLFDEGKWCDEKQFKNYVNRFFSLFEVPENTQLFVVPGNHDVGFHFAIDPYLMYTFENSFNTSTVQFLNITGNYFILLNSMAMEGDGCFLCEEAEINLRKIARELNCMKNKNCKRKHYKPYSRPILVQHFPMFRKSDAHCKEIDEAPPDIKNTILKENYDCLSKAASEMVYNQINPRVIFGGHLHHGCHTVHREDIHEYTLSSFSWRNKNNPTFILAKITPDEYRVKKCELPRETTVIFLYICVSLGCIMWIIYKSKKTKKHCRD